MPGISQGGVGAAGGHHRDEAGSYSFLSTSQASIRLANRMGEEGADVRRGCACRYCVREHSCIRHALDATEGKGCRDEAGSRICSANAGHPGNWFLST